MTLRERGVTVLMYTGFALVAVPFSILFVFLIIGHFYWAFLLITDQPIPRSKGGRVAIHRSRIETKIEGDEYFVKFPPTVEERHGEYLARLNDSFVLSPNLKVPEHRKFQKVSKSRFLAAIERENSLIRRTYIFDGFFLSVLVGMFLVKWTQWYESRQVRDISCPEGLRSLKALAKERGIAV